MNETEVRASVAVKLNDFAKAVLECAKVAEENVNKTQLVLGSILAAHAAMLSGIAGIKHTAVLGGLREAVTLYEAAMGKTAGEQLNGSSTPAKVKWES